MRRIADLKFGQMRGERLPAVTGIKLLSIYPPTGRGIAIAMARAAILISRRGTATSRLLHSPLVPREPPIGRVKKKNAGLISAIFFTLLP